MVRPLGAVTVVACPCCTSQNTSLLTLAPYLSVFPFCGASFDVGGGLLGCCCPFTCVGVALMTCWLVLVGPAGFGVSLLMASSPAPW